jgi:hypothetical protein
MEIRWYKAGTPRQDFDGYYCPTCECEKTQREKTQREKYAEVYTLYGEALAIESAIRRFKYTVEEYRGQDAPEDRWEKSNRWWANRLQNF